MGNFNYCEYRGVVITEDRRTRNKEARTRKREQGSAVLHVDRRPMTVRDVSCVGTQLMSGDRVG